MNDNVIFDKKTEESNVTKKNYVQPQLKFFGSIGALTTSGSLSPVEMANQPAGTMSSSDRNLKENIVKIGDHPVGFSLYLFDYKSEFSEDFGTDRQFGVMADEVEKIMPEAVVEHPDGYKMVNYGMLGINRNFH